MGNKGFFFTFFKKMSKRSKIVIFSRYRLLYNKSYLLQCNYIELRIKIRQFNQ